MGIKFEVWRCGYCKTWCRCEKSAKIKSHPGAFILNHRLPARCTINNYLVINQWIYTFFAFLSYLLAFVLGCFTYQVHILQYISLTVYIFLLFWYFLYFFMYSNSIAPSFRSLCEIVSVQFLVFHIFPLFFSFQILPSERYLAIEAPHLPGVLVSRWFSPFKHEVHAVCYHLM